jgi:putative transposase
MLAAVEHRFGLLNRLPVTIEWLSDNGSCYVASETRSFARDIGLEPRTTPIESPQSIGMAEACVRTIKRDYVHVSPCPDAQTVMHQLSLGLITTTRFTPTRHSDIVHPMGTSQLSEARDRTVVRGLQQLFRTLLW